MCCTSGSRYVGSAEGLARQDKQTVDSWFEDIHLLS